jgi:hypothetical protein
MEANNSFTSNSSGVLKNVYGRILVEKWPVITVKQNCQRARSENSAGDSAHEYRSEPRASDASL